MVAWEGINTIHLHPVAFSTASVLRGVWSTQPYSQIDDFLLMQE